MRRPKPKPILDPERVPADLSPAAKRIWRQLNQLWVFDPDQCLLLWDSLRSWDRCQEAGAIIEAEGIVVKTTTAAGVEKLQRNPACAVERESRQSFQAGFRLLGLSISDTAAPVGRPPGSSRGKR